MRIGMSAEEIKTIVDQIETINMPHIGVDENFCSSAFQLNLAGTGGQHLILLRFGRLTLRQRENCVRTPQTVCKRKQTQFSRRRVRLPSWVALAVFTWTRQTLRLCSQSCTCCLETIPALKSNYSTSWSWVLPG